MRPKSKTSARGSVENALEMVRKMIATDGLSANFDPCEPENRRIKDKIDLYVRTWVIPPLERALRKLTKKKERT